MNLEWDMTGWDYLITPDDAQGLIKWRREIVQTCMEAANVGDYVEADMWYQAAGLCPEDFEEYFQAMEGV